MIAPAPTPDRPGALCVFHLETRSHARRRLAWIRGQLTGFHGSLGSSGLADGPGKLNHFRPSSTYSKTPSFLKVL